MPSIVASTTSKSAAAGGAGVGTGCDIAGDEMHSPHRADSTIRRCRTTQDPMRISMLQVNWPMLDIYTNVRDAEKRTAGPGGCRDGTISRRGALSRLGRRHRD